MHRAVHRHGVEAVVPQVLGEPFGRGGAVRQQRDRGPGAGDDARDRAAGIAEPQRVAEARGQFDRGALQVVDQDPAQRVGVAAAQGLEDTGSTALGSSTTAPSAARSRSRAR